ncbi:MAG: flagellar export protein FliJ [Oscillospiraceae bacterium]|nr:flagellar export protein FliJ [Oscillospiraceae bacterium]
MKKFKFSLATVLDYKQQVLDALKGEHAAILAKVRAQEALLERIEERYSAYNLEFRDRKLEGLSIAEALLYENGLRALEREIRRETEVLHKLYQEEEAKRAEVVAAKQETASLEKLREKKLQSYNREVQKAEERLIDEFISAARAQAGA